MIYPNGEEIVRTSEPTDITWSAEDNRVLTWIKLYYSVDGGENFSFIDSVGAFRKGGISGSYKSYFENFYILRKHGISIFKSILNIFSSLIKVFIINNFPAPITRLLREKFSSGRFIK